ncbi:hypothetical protein J3D54_003574 [Pseudomonas sp. GGS8]|nr:hypothetical protein [Pseudomonas sp. GGS8]
MEGCDNGSQRGRELPHSAECGSRAVKNYSLFPCACKRSVLTPWDKLYT